MPDAPPNPELLRSLGHLVRGLSALFWGLPLALIICAGTASAGWFKVYGLVPPLVSTGLLLFGLWQLGAFQKQERPWRRALERTQLLALITFGLSPFLYWWNQLPGITFYFIAICVLGFCALLFLFNLNIVLQRLGAMLPDETLRLEIRRSTALNRTLLLAFFIFAILYFAISGTFQFPFPGLNTLQSAGDWLENGASLTFPGGLTVTAMWLVWVVICLLFLLPLAMTMALIWKTKEVILDSVFGAQR